MRWSAAICEPYAAPFRESGGATSGRPLHSPKDRSNQGEAMPSASHDQIELREIAPGYSSRFADWGGITVAFEKAHAGQDTSAMARGLPDDRCQAPHWSFLFSGKIVVRFEDHTETIEAGQAYYVAPGHAIEFWKTAKRSSSRRRRRSNGPSLRSGATAPRRWTRARSRAERVS